MERSAGCGAGKFGVIVAGADGGPQFPHTLLGEAGLFKRLFDVAGALARPGDVSEGSGGVVENVDADAGVVRAGQVGVAGAEAGAEDAEVSVALRLKPIDAAADIDNGLAAGGEGAADVGADRVVGALKLGGAANVVVRHGEAQGRNAHAIEDGAEGVVAESVGVPLGQNYDCLLGAGGSFVRGRRVPAGVDQVVFRVRRALGRGEAEVLGQGEFSVGSLLANGGFLGEGFRADVGGIGDDVAAGGGVAVVEIATVRGI